jgi:hypothetical protein
MRGRAVRANTRPMAMRRTTTFVTALAAAVLLVGCSDANSPSGSGPTAPTPTPEVAVAWANAVCTASTDLRASVQSAGATLEAGLSGSASSLEQTKEEVRGQVDAVQESAASLARTLSGVPVGADPQMAVLNELETASRGALAAVDKIRAAAAQVADAQTLAEVTAGLEALKAAVAEAATGLRTYLETLRTTVGPGQQAAQESFGKAPACQELTASVTASP